MCIYVSVCMCACTISLTKLTDMTTGHEVKDAVSQVETKISPKLLPASLQAEPAISELLGRRYSTEGGGETQHRETSQPFPALLGRRVGE